MLQQDVRNLGGYDPKVPRGKQTSVAKGYGSSKPTPNYPKNFCARGHQLPNYYWKAVLKVKRVDGEIVDATTIGFWLPHKDLKGHSYVNYTVSVDQIEQWQEFVSF